MTKLIDLPWNGGECPVHGVRNVDVLFRDGKRMKRRSDMTDWQHMGGSADVVAYHIIDDRSGQDRRATGKGGDVAPYGDNEPCKYCGAHSDDLTIAYMLGQTKRQPAAPTQIDAGEACTDEALTIADYEEVLADQRRLVREIDVIINGEDGAAKQASLCDLVGQIKELVAVRDYHTLNKSAEVDLDLRTEVWNGAGLLTEQAEMHLDRILAYLTKAGYLSEGMKAQQHYDCGYYDAARECVEKGHLATGKGGGEPAAPTQIDAGELEAALRTEDRTRPQICSIEWEDALILIRRAARAHLAKLSGGV